MRLSELRLGTLKETPADAEIVSHKLMLRAGLIRQLASGLYTWLPLGLRVIRNIERIVREEMDRAGALEILMPVVQPGELWEESGRWQEYGPELLRIQDRHMRNFCLGPTHEEVITDIVRREIRSYRQLPVNFYQIQTKFRDEIRPRFGVMRAREFMMKDAYSFHIDEASLEQGYQAMYDAYCAIFDRIGLNYRSVVADTGSIGGDRSHEFHVLADSGEDAIAFSSESDYAANIELAESKPIDLKRPPASVAMTTIDTPNVRTIEELTASLGVTAGQCVKTLIVAGDGGGAVALCLRGDHVLNPLKAERLDGVASPLRMAAGDEVYAAAGCEAGFVGPVGLNIPVYADRDTRGLADFVTGANAKDQHLTGVNWGRDLPEPEFADIRNVVAGDPSPDGRGTLDIVRGIEVGHIFILGDKYSAALGATVLDESGAARTLQMGCYGIGVTRIAAAAIEQNHDKHGIIWPDAIAPWQVALVPINMHKSMRLRDAATELYNELTAAGLTVLFDDRDVRPGVKFADIDLMGIPHRVVVGERGLDAGTLEYKARRDTETAEVSRQEIRAFLAERIEGVNA